MNSTTKFLQIRFPSPPAAISKNRAERARSLRPCPIIKHLNIKDQGCIGWNPGRRSIPPIGVLRRTSNDSPLPLLHLLDALVPSLDHHSDAQSEREWLLSAPGAVEYSSIEKPSGIVHGHFAADGDEFGFGRVSFVLDGDFEATLFLRVLRLAHFYYYLKILIDLYNQKSTQYKY